MYSAVLSVVFVMYLLAVSAATAAVRYIPGVAIVPEVRATDGKLRVYETPRGPMYWSPGCPIPPSDAIKLNLFVTTGGDSLESVKVRLDNKEIASLTSSPWSTEISAAKLGTGYHSVEAWAKCAGKGGKSNSATLLFFVGPAQEKQPHPEEATTDPAKSANSFIGVSQKDPGPAVTADQPSANEALSAGRPILLERPITLEVALPQGMTKLVYALVRDWKEEYRSPVLPGTDHIRLQPAVDKTPGLLPGDLQLIVWPADEKGRLGQPAVIAVSVPKQKEKQ